MTWDEARFRELLADAEAEAARTAQPESEGDTARVLRVEWVADVAARIAAEGPVRWLVKPVWPGDAYGVLAAEKKAGKTWAALDLAISVASGTEWLGVYPVEMSGPVLVFLGEGGERKMLRRLRAICESRGLRLEDLRIRLCHRVPALTSITQLDEIREEIEKTQPALVIIDPLYLAANGAKGSDLYAMGSVLSGVQAVCQAGGAALMVVTHWNKTGEGHGSHRMTGAGPAEWGRVLVSMGVEHRSTDPADRSTVATLRLSFEGDEIPETDLRIRRRISADDPDELASPLHYQLEILPGDVAQGANTDGLRPAERRVLAVLTEADDWLDVGRIGDLLAVDNTGMAPLKRRTIQAALKVLVDRGDAFPVGESGQALRWRACPDTSGTENVL